MIEADGGNINMTGRMRIGSVPQDPPGGDITVLDAVLAADVERTALLAEDETCHDGLRLAEIHARLDEIGAASAPARAASILHGLGFDNEAQGRPCGEFSGGWRMRVALAGTLFSNPDLLILDEPSNHLDLEAMLWLTEHLRRFRAHAADGQPRSRPAERRVRPHRAHRPAEARHLQRQLRPLRAHPRRAARARCRAAGQDRRPAQAHAGLRRPLQGQGQQGAPGPVAHQDDREAGTDRNGAGRRADRLQLPGARAPRLADRDDRRGHRSATATARRCCASSTCASTWTTASRCSARTATASRPSSACCRTA